LKSSIIQSDKIKIGVSSCLLGNRVRYDGDHQYQKAVVDLQNEFELISFCPEVEIGLGVPRPKIQLVKVNDTTRCLDFDTKQIDYTEALSNCSISQKEWLDKISGYIFKNKSPSCGLSKVKMEQGKQVIANGVGIFSSKIMSVYPELPLIEEEQFQDATLAANFIDSVREYSKRFI